MQRTVFRFAVASTLCASAIFTSLPAFAISFGKKDSGATAKVTRGEVFKGQTRFALGAFRVAFITSDKVVSVSSGMFAGGGASASMTGDLIGLDHALMQKITDQIYADFMKQAAAKGYTVVDSKTLAQSSASYKAMTPAENFAAGRFQALVIPTGQQSVELAADNSAKEEKGAKGFMSAVHNIGAMQAKSDANKAFPEAAKEAGMPVIGVTIVVTFADFKGGHSSFGSAKAGIQSGATIDGKSKQDVLPATYIVGWDAKTKDCAVCMAEVALEGSVHSDESIGSADTRSRMTAGDHIANGINALNGLSQTNKKGMTIVVEPVAYEKNVLLVAAEANAILLDGLTKEK